MPQNPPDPNAVAVHGLRGGLEPRQQLRSDEEPFLPPLYPWGGHPYWPHPPIQRLATGAPRTQRGGTGTPSSS